jgi:large repetitive protein
MRHAIRYTFLTIGLFAISFALKASLPQVATGTWGSANNMSSLHDGGCSALLQDSRMLVSGGSDAAGPTAKVDVFNTDGTWSSASSMLSPRAHQVCALLQNGQVLVAGGITAGGGVTNSTEIFDPAANSWSQLPPMSEARAGATASLLQDGRVLVAGGQTSGGPSNTIEIFDPNAGAFSFAGTMSTSRQNAAATVLQDGRVLIVGGSGVDANGNGIILGSSDIYDPTAATDSVGPTLTTARKNHTATTQLDGKVVVIGGSNGSNDLASVEAFDPSVGGNFASVSASLAMPRSEHVAFLLPKNNEVLIVGGQSDLSGQETDTASAELYVPWGNQGGGEVQPTGWMSVARSQASGAPVSIIDGLLMVAGGSSQTSAELYSFATVKTDQSDYAPGTIVTITGSGWQPGETVTLTLLESPLIDTHPVMTAVADQNGNIFNNQFSPDSHDVDVRFFLTASGSQSQAENSFTDSKPNTVTVGAQSPVTLAAGSTATFPIAVSYNGNGSACTSPLSVTGLPTGAFGSFSPASVSNSNGNSTLTVTTNSTTTPAGSYIITVTAGQGGGQCQTGTAQGTGTLIVSAPPLITSGNNAMFTVGTASSFTVMTTGVPAPTLTETGTLPSGVTLTDNGNGTAILGGTPALGTVNTYPFTIKATNSAGTATQAFTLTVAKVNSSFSNLSSPTMTLGTASVTLSGKVSAYASSGGTVTATVNGVTSAPASLTGSANNFSITFNTQTLGVGTYQVTYTYSGDANAKGATDSSTTLTVNNPVPTTTSISPSSTSSGAASFVLTVDGTNFVSTSVVQFNGSALTTTFGSDTQVTATVPAAALTTAGQFVVTVVNPAPGGGTSNSQTFTVNKRSTLTAIACSPGTINVNQSATCTATVSDTDSGTASTPTGIVNFTATVGSFTPTSCTLSGSKCSVGYNAASTGGAPTVTGSYGGDTTHGTSSGSTNITVNAQQATTLTVSSAGGTYGGTTNLSANLTVMSGGGGERRSRQLHLERDFRGISHYEF